MARICTAAEIIDALNIIKSQCQQSANCEQCPFGSTTGLCMITKETPVSWNIVSERAITKFLY